MLIGTLKTKQRLTKGGAFTEAQAERIVEALGSANEQATTKDDLEMLRSDVESLEQALRSNIEALERKLTIRVRVYGAVATGVSILLAANYFFG